MAFGTSELRESASKLLISGMKPKAILSELGNGCAIADLYTLKQELKKAGKISGGGIHKSADAKPKKTKKKGKDQSEFDRALEAEIERVRSEIERLNNLAATYDSTNSDFASHLEKKVVMEQKKLAQLEEFQN